MLRRRDLLSAAAALGVSGVIFTGCSSATTAGTTATPTVAPRANVQIPLGRPVLVHAFHYTKLFEEKPFADAILVYLDNGSYKIYSQGEEHYGSYVSNTASGTAPSEVRFLSWPSQDWGNNVAAHWLQFDPVKNTFDQQLTRPGTTTPLHQQGFYAAIADPASFDLNSTWKQLLSQHAATFADLTSRSNR